MIRFLRRNPKSQQWELVEHHELPVVIATYPTLEAAETAIAKAVAGRCSHCGAPLKVPEASQ